MTAYQAGATSVVARAGDSGTGTIAGGIWTSLKHEFTEFIGGFGTGFGNSAKEVLASIGELIKNPDDAARAMVDLLKNPQDIPEAFWDGLTKAIRDDWNDGKHGEAVGRGAFLLVEAMFGSKGLSKVPDGVAFARKKLEARGWTPARLDFLRAKYAFTPKQWKRLEAAYPIGSLTPSDLRLLKQQVDAEGITKRLLQGLRAGVTSGPLGDARTAEALLSLQQKKVNVSPEAVVWARKLPSNTAIQTKAGAIFLEAGSPDSGLRHIVSGNPAKGTGNHGKDFAAKGISEQEIPDLIQAAVMRGKLIHSNAERGAYFFQVEFGGTTHYVKLGIGNNGYVVTAHPIKDALAQKYIAKQNALKVQGVV